MQDGDEQVEVPVLRARAKGVDDASLGLHVRVRGGVALLDAPARAAGELAGRVGRALDDGRDLLEGHPEEVDDRIGQVRLAPRLA